MRYAAEACSYNFVRASERELGVNALLFSEPDPDGSADGFERRVAAMDRAARGSVVRVQALRLHVSVQPSPSRRYRTRNVSVPLSEPECWASACVVSVSENPLYRADGRLPGRWSASCRSAVTGQSNFSDPAKRTLRAICRGNVGLFCSGVNTISILHVGDN